MLIYTSPSIIVYRSYRSYRKRKIENNSLSPLVTVKRGPNVWTALDKQSQTYIYVFQLAERNIFNQSLIEFALFKLYFWKTFFIELQY